MAGMSIDEAIAAWKEGHALPPGWSIDVEDEPEGGQPNGGGFIEATSEREWFTESRETHHRERAVIEITGPWIEGQTASAQRAKAREVERIEATRTAEEERILRQAAEIQARRASA